LPWQKRPAFSLDASYRRRVEELRKRRGHFSLCDAPGGVGRRVYSTHPCEEGVYSKDSDE
jgi:hypothetical protein